MVRSFLARAAITVLCGVVHAPAKADPVSLNLLFDGDSISASMGASSAATRLDTRVTAALGPGVRLHNVAVGGRPVFECLRLYSQLVATAFDPAAPGNVIMFHAGDNDIAAGRDAGQTYAAFTEYVAAAHRQGWKVVVSTELRRWDFPPPKEAQILEYNDMLRRNIAGADAVADLDTDPRLRDQIYRSDPAIFTHDRVHPSDGGYAVLAGMLAPVVKRIVER